MADVTAIGVGTGPGNFTGVRISVAAARGLALGLAVPAIGVTRLEAAACGLPRPVTVVEDARRDEVYVQRFAADGPGPAQIMAAGVVVAGAVAGRDGLHSLPIAEAIARIAATRAGTAAAAPCPVLSARCRCGTVQRSAAGCSGGLGDVPAEMAVIHAACFTTPPPWSEAEILPRP